MILGSARTAIDGGGRDIVSELLFSKCNWNNVPESLALRHAISLDFVPSLYRAAY